MGKSSSLRLFAAFCSLLLAGCGGLWKGANPLAQTTPAPSPVQPTSSPVPAYLWISPAVPDALRQVAENSGLPVVATSETATICLDVQNPASTSNNQQTSTWFYALVTPFPTTTDEVSLADIQNAWTGAPSGPFAGRPLWMDESTQNAFSELWGAPASGSVQVVQADQLVDSAWSARPAWAIVTFEALEPRWKVLSVDDQSPVQNDFDPVKYPLKITFSLQPSAFGVPASNRDPNKLTVLAMTGTTALVRGTADRMEKNGVLYPGQEIRSVLRVADITHISNEVSFDAKCPKPDPWSESLFFCSNPQNIELLEDVGVDVVELTGNHLLDYGPADLLTTLDMYDLNGWKYYGGGRNLQDALQPALMENNGNKLAFIGCNIAGPPSDWATDSRPGSAPCDLDKLVPEIKNLRSQGYLPIMTFQYHEYYQSKPTYEEQADFRRMAEAGAVIVSGSQAHEPASMEIFDGSFVHYGLGNLFFDQMFSLETRELFVDRHVFYNGKYISTELLTYISEDFGRPRPMTALERTQFLEKIFKVAGW